MPNYVYPVVVIGDSISARGAAPLLAMKPNWFVDGVPGRKVDRLKPRIQYTLDNYGTPNHMVLALGTNEVPGWTKADYREAVQMIPQSVQIHFITLYRDPDFFGADRAATMKTYSDWMGQLDSEYENVHRVGWRTPASNGTIPLEDGVHPTPEGAGMWAQLVYDNIFLYN